MANQELKHGDVVFHKTAPRVRMTVHHFKVQNDEGHPVNHEQSKSWVVCKYWLDDGKFYTELFHPDELKIGEQP